MVLTRHVRWLATDLGDSAPPQKALRAPRSRGLRPHFGDNAGRLMTDAR